LDGEHGRRAGREGLGELGKESMGVARGVNVHDESTTMRRVGWDIVASVLRVGAEMWLLVSGVVGFCKSKNERLKGGESEDSVKTVIDGQRFGITAFLLRRGLVVDFIEKITPYVMINNVIGSHD
jgi:hypothetical protein